MSLPCNAPVLSPTTRAVPSHRASRSRLAKRTADCSATPSPAAQRAFPSLRATTIDPELLGTGYWGDHVIADEDVIHLAEWASDSITHVSRRTGIASCHDAESRFLASGGV